MMEMLALLLLVPVIWTNALLHTEVRNHLVIDDEAVQQLAEVFDIPALKVRHRDVRHYDVNRTRSSGEQRSLTPSRIPTAAPSPYMLSLYNAIADANGVMRIPNPYKANLIRSFQNKDLLSDNQVSFDLSTVEVADEQILQAELHLRIQTLTAFPADTEVLVTVYQLDAQHQRDPLVSKRVVLQSANQTLVFPVRSAALHWINNPDDNNGLQVDMVSAGSSRSTGHQVRSGAFKLAKAAANPVLILFMDDGREKHNPKYRIKSQEKQALYLKARLQRIGQEDLISSFNWAAEPKYRVDNVTSRATFWEKQMILAAQRRKRSVVVSGKSRNYRKRYQKEKEKTPRVRGPCRRHELFVNFEEIGWSSWIISPKGFQAFHCRGDCHFPIGQESKPSNHATVISIINHLKLRKRVGAPCCVPEKLYSISLLYFDNDQNVVLKQYDDMVAQSCACR